MDRQNDDSPALKLTGKIVMVAMFAVFVVVAFFLFLHLYVQYFWQRQRQEAATNGLPPRRRRRRFDFGAGYQETASAAVLRRGLDPSVLKSIPVIVFHGEEFKEGLECSVCLSDITQGEKARLLPKCNHGFHVDCIDMWFKSHSTCPLCRNPISSTDELSPENPQQSSSTESIPSETFSFPTNVLFWGDETQVSTRNSNSEENDEDHTCYHPHCPSSSSSTSNNRSEGMIAIDIPKDVNEEEEVKSPVIKRLMRLLSKCSTSNSDVEGQAGREQS